MSSRPPSRPGPPEPSLRDDVAHELAGAAKLAGGALANRVESTVTFFLLAILLVPIGLVAFVASMLVLSWLSSVDGMPTGTIGTLIRLGWLGLSLAGLILIYRALFRRLPRRVREHAVPGLEGPNDAADQPTSGYVREHGQSETTLSTPGSPSLAELDARLAPREPPV